MIVIAASAGGVEALSTLVAGLPPDFPAAVLVVVHFPAHATSMLPAILVRHGRLPALQPADGTALRPGVIYVAPPGQHMLVEGGRTVRLTRGPRENGHRPAADPLFRSAAVCCGSRVVGVVLSGNLDDGTAGLAAVARHGGVTVVQDPDDAMFSGMPRSAIAGVEEVDHVVPLAALAGLLVELVGSGPGGGSENGRPDDAGDVEGDDLEGDVTEASDHVEAEIADLDPAALQSPDRPGVPSGFTCPECHGALWEIQEDNLVRYRCRVGHAYGAETLLAEQDESVEAALWAAFRALKERSAIARRMLDRMEERGSARSAESFRQQVEEAERRADVIRRVLRNGGVTELEPAQTGTAPV